MSPLDPLGPILAQVRVRALALKRKEGQAGATSEESGSGSESPPGLIETVLAAVAGIPAELPDRPKRAFRAYLQAVLAQELGLRETGSGGFQDLLQRVIASMEEEPALRAAMVHAGEVLLSRAALSSGE